MTIQVAQTTDNDWRHPIEDVTPGRRWCYSCWHTHAADVVPEYCEQLAHPQTIGWPLAHATYAALRELGVPQSTQAWQPAHAATVRALVAELQDRIDWIDRMAALAAATR